VRLQALDGAAQQRDPGDGAILFGQPATSAYPGTCGDDKRVRVHRGI
jgi:hypothetical protein